MKIESTGWKITDIIEGSSDRVVIAADGEMLTLHLSDGAGYAGDYAFSPNEAADLRHALTVAIGKAADLRNEQTQIITPPAPDFSPAPGVPSVFDLMREGLASWREVAAENHEANGHRSEFVVCCRDLSPNDVRTLINDAERDYAKRTAAANAAATAATA